MVTPDRSRFERFVISSAMKSKSAALMVPVKKTELAVTFSPTASLSLPAVVCMVRMAFALMAQQNAAATEISMCLVGLMLGNVIINYN